MADASISFKYALVDISVKKFCIEILGDGKLAIDKLPLNFEINFTPDSINEKIQLLIIARVYTPESEAMIAELGAEFTFLVQGLRELEAENDQIKIPEPFLINLINIGYGTLRGIFFERVANTALRHLILPVIYPKDLINQEEKN